jgi:hypothetical protein
MSRTLRSWFSVLASSIFVGLLASCGTAPLLKPGDHLSDMVVTNQKPASRYEGIAAFCDVPSDSSTPTSITITCSDVPRGTILDIGWGWLSATQQELENAWSAMRWQIIVDGQELDLASFGTQDTDREGGGRIRAWQAWLEEPTPGKHTVRIVYHVTRAFKDSMDDLAVGDYEKTFSFTVK